MLGTGYSRRITLTSFANFIILYLFGDFLRTRFPANPERALCASCTHIFVWSAQQNSTDKPAYIYLIATYMRKRQPVSILSPMNQTRSRTSVANSCSQGPYLQNKKNNINCIVVQNTPNEMLKKKKEKKTATRT